MKAVSVQVVSCCVYVKSLTNYALHAWQHSILVWLLGQSIWLSPSTKELHGLSNFWKVLVENFLKKVAQIFGNFLCLLWAKTFPVKLLWATFWAMFGFLLIVPYGHAAAKLKHCLSYPEQNECFDEWSRLTWGRRLEFEAAREVWLRWGRWGWHCLFAETTWTLK